MAVGESRTENALTAGRSSAAGGSRTSGFTIEFTDAPIEYHAGSSFGFEHDELTCRDSDVGPSGWVDGNDAAALAAAFDTITPGDGVYEGITRARVSTTDRVDWGAPNLDSRAFGTHAMFNVQVKQDIDVNTNSQELFVGGSYSYGDLGADGVPDLRTFVGDVPGDCRPRSIADWPHSGLSLIHISEPTRPY